MSEWASLIFIVPKKDERPNSFMSNSTKPKKELNLRLCINYMNLNGHILTGRQIKSDGSIGKVIENYPLPTIANLLARFKEYKYFSTIDLRSGYYHIRVSKEAADKTVFIIDKGKWIFHSLLFSINIGPLAFWYVLLERFFHLAKNSA